MAKVTVKLNLAGLNRIMRSDAVQAKVDQIGKSMAADAGEDFEYVSSPHKWVARGFVQPGSARAAREQAKNAVLERALSQNRRA